MTGFPQGFDPATLGARVAEGGLDEIENLLPEEWREQVRAFPLTAVAVGIGLGIWLGLKKSDDVIAAGSTLVSSAVMGNVAEVMEKMKG
jgi:hypothetical protein